MKRFPRIQARALLLLVGVLALAGCGSDSRTAHVEQAETRWKTRAVPDYVFSYSYGCYCPPEGSFPARVVVKNGKAVSATFSDGRTADGRGVTVDDLFATVRMWLDKSPDGFSFQADPTYDYPQSVEVDFDKHAIDDEVGMTIDCFEPGNPSGACPLKGPAPPKRQ
jgi:hypothetical protein